MIELLGLSVPLVKIHIGILIAVVLVIIYADHEGFMWMRGKKELLSEKSLKITHKLMWTGVVLMLLTGFFLFLPLKDYLFTNPAFIAKMVFVLALFVNGFFVGKFMHVATYKRFAELTPEEKKPLFIVGGISGTSWAGAIISALLMGL